MMNSDPFDSPMEDIPTMSERDEDAYNAHMNAIAEAASLAVKTDTEIQIDQLHDLLANAKLNSWESGFCQSCLAWLEKNPAINRLSFKQKDVLGKTVSKHFHS